MIPTQERIVEYLNSKHLSLSKDSTDEDRAMFEFLIKHRLMSEIKKNDYASITNDGQSFLSSAYYFDPVPLNVYDWKMNIIDQLKGGQAILKGDGSLHIQAHNELKQDGIIEQVGTSYSKTLTSKGRRFIESGLSYNDFLNNPNKQISISVGQIGHNITNSPVSQSDLSIDALNHSIAPPSNTQPTQTSKNKIKSMLMWIVRNIWKCVLGVLIGLAVLYIWKTYF